MTDQTSDPARPHFGATRRPGDRTGVKHGAGGPSLRVRFGLVVLALVVFGCAAGRSDASGGPGSSPVTAPSVTAGAPVPTSSARPTPTVPTPPTVGPSLAGWYPAGFAVSPLDPTVAYRWMSKNQFRCDPGPVCWGLQVVARDGCVSDLTIELSLADSAGGALGVVFDTAGEVRVGQQAMMVFEVQTPGAKKAEISKISCT